MSSHFKWSDFLELARRLAVDGADEAAQRTTISRAYYAAYCSAAEYLLQSWPGLAADLLTHDTVWHAFAEPNDDDLWRLFQNGTSLRAARIRADYQNPMIGKSVEAQLNDSLRQSRRALEALERIG